MDFDITQINNIWQLIGFIVVIFASTTLPIILKNKALKKKNQLQADEHKKEIENLKDSQQDERLSKIENKLDNVIDVQTKMNNMLKDSEFLKKIDIDTNTILNDLMVIKKLENNELSYALAKGQQKFGLFVRRILYSNFKISAKEIQKSYHNFLKSIKSDLCNDKEKLNLKKPENFIFSLQNYLVNRLDLFILEFGNYKDLINGDRRKNFKDELKKLFTDIVHNSIELYHKEL